MRRTLEQGRSVGHSAPRSRMIESTKSKRPGRQRQYSSERRLTQFRLEPEVRAALDAYCSEKGQTIQVCLERLVKKLIEDEKKRSH